MSQLIMQNNMWEWRIGDDYYVRINISIEGLIYKAIDSSRDEYVFVDTFQTMGDFIENGAREMFDMPSHLEEEIKELTALLQLD